MLHANQSMMKRARESGSADAEASSWRDEVSAAIQNGDSGDVKEIASQLLDLVSAAQRRLISLKANAGTGVVLVDSNQSQDQDVRRNMCSRSVSAEFTAGPNRRPFSMSFENENVDGEETITIYGPCFFFDEVQPSQFTFEFDDDEIEEFLMAAGLHDSQPEAKPEEYELPNNMTPQERRRWVLGDVICDAVGLVHDKYGTEDSCGVGLGMGQYCAYGWLGFKY